MSGNNKDAGNAATSLSKRLALIGAFAALIAAFFAYDLDALISYQGLAENEAALKRAVADNRLVAILAYMAVYITAVAFSLPGALWLSLAGGLMFGTWAGGLIIIFAATIGARVYLLRRVILSATHCGRGPGQNGGRLCKNLRPRLIATLGLTC